MRRGTKCILMYSPQMSLMEAYNRGDCMSRSNVAVLVWRSRFLVRHFVMNSSYVRRSYAAYFMSSQ